MKLVWRTLPVALFTVAALIGLDAAEARPGGGQSYSGGSSGGGGGGGGGELVMLLIRLVIFYPQVGIPLAVVCGIGFFYFQRQHSATNAADWDSVGLIEFEPPADLTRVRNIDPAFSTVLFEDFLFRLYATTHKQRALPLGLAQLAPYLGEGPRDTLERHEPVGVGVNNVVIGSMKFANLVVPGTPYGPGGEPHYVKVDVTFESNMTTSDGKLTMYAIERWRLARAASTISKPPGSSRDFPCPNCGAKFTAGDQGQCNYCDQPVGTGAFDWIVYQVDSLGLEKRPPMISKTVNEAGTDAPTIVDPAAAQVMASIYADDPNFTEQALDARVRLIYHELNTSWTACDLRPVRGFVSDGLYDYLGYWVDSYLQQGLRNQLVDMRVTGWVIAKAVRDKYFDSVTLRVWGTGHDFTVKADSGKVVTGSKRSERPYSEYWTLIRSAARRGPVRSDKMCPNCGAALQINMAGNCEFCSAHVTAGEFDWVLSKIEQDESYG